MWATWQTSKSLSCRPSRLLEIEDSLAAYCFDSAVSLLGTVIENALAERTEGEGQSERKYTIEQLLDPAFTLPRPQTAKQKRRQAGATLRAMVGQGVKRFKERGNGANLGRAAH